MTVQEQAKLLAGSEADRRSLMSSLISKMMDGQTLTSTEVIFMEALKREFVDAEQRITNVVSMSATLNGQGGVGG